MAHEASVDGAGLQLDHPEEVTNGFIQKQHDRIGMLRSMVDSIGVINTGRAVYDRMRSRGAYGRNDIVQATASQARFPLLVGINPNDLANYTEIFREDVYALPSEIADTVDGKYIVDLGAFTGLATAYLASRYRKSQLLSVEPNPRNYELLAANAEPFGEQIKPLFAAVSPVPGVVGASHPRGDAHDYMSIHFAVGDTGLEPVPLARVPEVVTPTDIVRQTGEDAIGILKVDIEGAEQALFQSGAVDELLGRTAVLMIETHDRYVAGCTDAVRTAIMRNGFERHASESHTATFLNPDFVQ